MVGIQLKAHLKAHGKEIPKVKAKSMKTLDYFNKLRTKNACSVIKRPNVYLK